MSRDKVFRAILLNKRHDLVTAVIIVIVVIDEAGGQEGAIDIGRGRNLVRFAKHVYDSVLLGEGHTIQMEMVPDDDLNPLFGSNRDRLAAGGMA